MTLKMDLANLGDHQSSPWFKPELMSDKYSAFLKTIEEEKYGFFKATETDRLIQTCEEVHNKFQDRTTFVQVGIGALPLVLKCL